MKPGVLTSYVKAFESYSLTDRQTDRQTRPKLYTTLLRRWSTHNKKLPQNIFVFMVLPGFKHV